MKFIVDAQLPMGLANYLRRKGHDVIHTRELPAGNLTEDLEVIRISMQDQRVVISKDRDFFDCYVLRQQPWKLLTLTTGNIVTKTSLPFLTGISPKYLRSCNKTKWWK